MINVFAGKVRKTGFFQKAGFPGNSDRIFGICYNNQKLWTMLAESVVDVLVKGQPTAKAPGKIDPEPIVSINQAMMQSPWPKIPRGDLEESDNLLEAVAKPQ
jgi:hypothetical protein